MQTDSDTQIDTHTNIYNIVCSNNTYIYNKREVVISITKPSNLQAKLMIGLVRNVHRCNDNKTSIILVNHFWLNLSPIQHDESVLVTIIRPETLAREVISYSKESNTFILLNVYSIKPTLS